MFSVRRSGDIEDALWYWREGEVIILPSGEKNGSSAVSKETRDMDVRQRQSFTACTCSVCFVARMTSRLEKQDTRTYARARTHTHTYTRAHTHTHTRACTLVHIDTHTHVRTYTCMHAHMRASAHTHTRTHTHTHARTHARARARAHTALQTKSVSRP